jgi:membrane-associated protein
LGELTWIAIYGGLGYAFGSQWELISDFISNFSGFILGGLVLGVGIYLLVRFGKKPAASA